MPSLGEAPRDLNKAPQGVVKAHNKAFQGHAETHKGLNKALVGRNKAHKCITEALGGDLKDLINGRAAG